MNLAVIGIGNRFCGDDSAGIRVARILRVADLPGVTILESNGDGATLMEMWQGFDSIILVDAMRSGAIIGTVRRFDAGANPLPPEVFCPHSTHVFGVASAVELARVLHQFPFSLVMYGIEGGRFDAGSDLSPEVEAGAYEAVAMIMAEVRSTTFCEVIVG